MVYFYSWKHDNYQDATTYYECETCRKNGYDKQRVCFKYDLTEEDDGVLLRVPYRDDNGRWAKEERFCGLDDVLEMLYELEVSEPSIPSFEALVNKIIEDSSGNRIEICPIGLMDDSTWDLITIEGLCDAYKMAPCYPPTLDAQPPILMEAFMVIRAEKNRYEAVKLERMKNKNN